jgi:hypothetical protein
MTDKQVRDTLSKALRLRRAGRRDEADGMFAKLVNAGIRISPPKVGTPIKDTVIHRVAATTVQ